jgi:hypothetical protein
MLFPVLPKTLILDLSMQLKIRQTVDEANTQEVIRKRSRDLGKFR